MLRIINDALTFDDVLIVPSYSQVLPNNVNLSTQLTQKISINIPILSAAMDSITEHRLAISLAKEGGIGFIHKNMSIEKQIKEVNIVKKYKKGIINNPQCVLPNTKLGDIKKLIIKNGFYGYPVVTKDNLLVGIITKRDINFVTDLNQSVSSIMTTKDKLVTVKQGETHDIILSKMYEYRIEKILIVDNSFHLIGMITLKDIKESLINTNACKDKYGCLRVGAAIDVGIDMEDRIKLLVNAGVDVLLLDSSHGHSRNVILKILNIKNMYPNLQLIGGNVATKSGALALLQSGVDAVKVGIGPGSICTTRVVTGVGIPQLTAISDVAEALSGTDIPIIADGGIRCSGDIAKSIAAGAHSVMVGLMLAGTKEASGKMKKHNGKLYKSYRGMGSLGAISQYSASRYFQSYEKNKFIPEGVEGNVLYNGNLKDIIYYQMGGLRSCMGLTGCNNIKELRTKTKFVRISNAGIRESHVHDVVLI
ncbi:MAG: IMP dehydrogenase [Enterobacterales bacterium]